MKKVDILGLHLGFGGTEQAIINQANMLCDKFNVRLVVTYKLQQSPAFYINHKVSVIYLTELKPNRKELKKAISTKNFFKLFRESLISAKILITKYKTMKRYITKSDADILISSRLSIHKLLKRCAKDKVIKIAEEHTYSLKNKKYLSNLKKACKNFQCIACVSKEICSSYQKLLPKTNCIYIPNALEKNNQRNIADYTSNNILMIGRLSKEKGIIDALKIIKNISQKNKNIQLHIIGEGPERNAIERKIIKEGLKNNVILHGFKDHEYIKKIASMSSLLLITSYEESFGTVSIEAASYGLPTISFESAKGILEIVKNKKTGIIIRGRDNNSMASTIQFLLNDRKRLAILGQKAFEESKKYKFERIQKDWLNLLISLLDKKEQLS